MEMWGRGRHHSVTSQWDTGILGFFLTLLSLVN